MSVAPLTRQCEISEAFATRSRLRLSRESYYCLKTSKAFMRSPEKGNDSADERYSMLRMPRNLKGGCLLSVSMPHSFVGSQKDKKDIPVSTLQSFSARHQNMGIHVTQNDRSVNLHQLWYPFFYNLSTSCLGICQIKCEQIGRAHV